MVALLASAGTNPAIDLRENKLPAPFGWRVWILSDDLIWHTAVAISQVTIIDLLYTLQMMGFLARMLCPRSPSSLSSTYRTGVCIVRSVCGRDYTSGSGHKQAVSDGRREKAGVRKQELEA